MDVTTEVSLTVVVYTLNRNLLRVVVAVTVNKEVIGMAVVIILLRVLSLVKVSVSVISTVTNTGTV